MFFSEKIWLYMSSIYEYHIFFLLAWIWWPRHGFQMAWYGFYYFILLSHICTVKRQFSSHMMLIFARLRKFMAAISWKNNIIYDDNRRSSVHIWDSNSWLSGMFLVKSFKNITFIRYDYIVIFFPNLFRWNQLICRGVSSEFV